MYEFGLGSLFSNNSDGTSVEFGDLQNCDFSVSFDKKELYGRKQAPVKVARGKGKYEGKAGFANIRAAALNQILGGTISTGQLKVAEPTNATVPAATPFTITISPPGTGTFGKILAVYDVSDPTVKKPMTKVASAPITGQYSISAGVLTFAAADLSKKIQYVYDYNLTTGNTITLTNNNMGTAPVFQIEMYNTLDGKNLTLLLNACTTTKFGLNFKQEDFTIPDFDFSAFADSSDIIGYVYLDE